MNQAFRVACATLAIAAISCSGENDLEPCDIRQESCQQSVFLAVQDARGSTFDPWTRLPPMRVITMAQYRTQVEAERAQREALDPRFDYFAAALKLLYLLDPAEPPSSGTDFEVDSFVAYYDSRDRAITIIDRGERTDHCEDVRTLGHELVHAAQDLDINLQKFYDGVDTEDGYQLADTMVEGEAVLYEDVLNEKQRNAPACDGQGGAIDQPNWIAYTRDMVAGSASPYRPATTLLRYPLGLRFMSEVYADSGPLGIRRAFDKRPDATSQFIADDESTRARSLPRWSCRTPETPAGYTYAYEDRLGAYSTYAFATRVFDEAAAWQSASAYAGDSFSLYMADDEEEQLAVIWSLRFVSADDAQAMAAHLAESPIGGALQTQVQNDVLHVFASSRPLEPAFSGWPSCD